MKKHIRTVIVLAILIGMGLTYYFYLSNKPDEGGKNEPETSGNDNVSALIVRDINANYPQSPREVVKLYSEIMVAYYKKTTTVSEVEALGKQARLLFDRELLQTQTESEFLQELQKEVTNYNAVGKVVADFKVDTASNFEYKTLDDNRDYAIGTALYYTREGRQVLNVYHSYKLRKDEDGKWKILYWELVDSVPIE